MKKKTLNNTVKVVLHRGQEEIQDGSCREESSFGAFKDAKRRKGARDIAAGKERNEGAVKQ